MPKSKSRKARAVRAKEDRTDLQASREAMTEANEKGTVPWEQAKRELGLPGEYATASFILDVSLDPRGTVVLSPGNGAADAMLGSGNGRAALSLSLRRMAADVMLGGVMRAFHKDQAAVNADEAVRVGKL